MSASTRSARVVTRLPIPLVFMAISIGIFVLMAVLTFAPATMPDGEPATTEPRPEAAEMPAPEAGTPIAPTAQISDRLGMAPRANERRCYIDDAGL